MSALPPVFLLTAVYFLTGAAGVAVIKRKNPDIGGWVKFWVYFIIVHFILLLTLFFPEYLGYVFSLLLLIGLSEIIRVKPSRRILLPSVVIYLLVAVTFFLFLNLPLLVLYTYVVVFTFDGFSQIGGQLFGRTAISSISPGKTWEGTFTGFIAGIITMYFLYLVNPELLPKHFIPFTMLLMAIALAGDFGASWYKRRCGVKDFATYIPGHGGVLDRFDSFFAAGAFSGLWYFCFSS